VISTATIPATATSDDSQPVLEVDLDALAANWQLLARRAGRAECGAVVKADGYGLGAPEVARTLYEAGCRTFFVTYPGEALALRPLLADARLCVLHGIPEGGETEAATHGLVPVLNQLDEIRRWRLTASRLGRRLPAIVHLDTGMNRLGLGAAVAATLAGEPGLLDGIDLAGWMSHLSCADLPDHPMTAQQVGHFDRLLATLPAAPASLANSSGHFRGPELLRDLTRPGAALYGVNPTPEAANPMRAVVRLLGRILQVREVDAPAAVGYGADHRVTGRTTIATIAIGYADGYHRALGSRGFVRIGGIRAPVVGRISMDLMTVDASAVPLPVLAAVRHAEIIGAARDVDAVAAEAGTIGYEILTGLGPRMRRVWRRGGAPASC
jgi:alanine racemase